MDLKNRLDEFFFIRDSEKVAKDKYIGFLDIENGKLVTNILGFLNGCISVLFFIKE